MSMLARPTPTDSRSGRDRILVEAAQLFLTRGYAETSLRTIAEAAEMQPASIYHHFDSKDALLTEILAIGMDAVNEAFDDVAAESPAASGWDLVTRHMVAHLDALFVHQSFTAAHVTVFPFAPEAVRAAAVPARDAYEARWTDLLAEAAPHLGSDERQLARLTIFGVMNSSLQWFDPTRGDVSELGERLGALLGPGLAGSETKEK